MLIKRLSPGDERQAHELAKVFHQSEGSEAQVKEFLANQLNYLIAAYIEEKPVGFLIGHEIQRFDGKPSKIYLHEIDVVNSARKQGIGRLLIAELQKTSNGRKIFLITDPTHEEAMLFYPGTGATEISNNNVLFEYPEVTYRS